MTAAKSTSRLPAMRIKDCNHEYIAIESCLDEEEKD